MPRSSAGLALGSSPAVLRCAALPAETAVLATGRASGAVDILNPCTGEVLGAIPAAAPAANGSGSSAAAAEAAALRGLHWVWGGGAAAPALLSVMQGGAARLHAAAEDDDADGAEGSSGSAWRELRSWQVPSNVCCTVGGRGALPSLHEHRLLACLRACVHACLLVCLSHSPASAVSSWETVGAPCCPRCRP